MESVKFYYVMESVFGNCYYVIENTITYGHSDKGSISAPIPKIGP